ncbi:hypothetical protein SmJEL517_g05467 [Synchytrium microbalum]|uniref:protein-tyrosine-phosphatase n=1 Tax=Synchytrium microbalum TaxID=1806994 RepID=A0A507BV71_9FUNG|nr:uncharacterized protein SmJEL517_g05467 [Synchytrium microbalum]TPX31148.1 hypothetical protein SmJEL517_g05467 [Synchytrium microbalum]
MREPLLPSLATVSGTSEAPKQSASTIHTPDSLNFGFKKSTSSKALLHDATTPGSEEPPRSSVTSLSDRFFLPSLHERTQSRRSSMTNWVSQIDAIYSKNAKSSDDLSAMTRMNNNGGAMSTDDLTKMSMNGRGSGSRKSSADEDGDSETTRTPVSGEATDIPEPVMPEMNRSDSEIPKPTAVVETASIPSASNVMAPLQAIPSATATLLAHKQLQALRMGSQSSIPEMDGETAEDDDEMFIKRSTSRSSMKLDRILGPRQDSNASLDKAIDSIIQARPRHAPDSPKPEKRPLSSLITFERPISTRALNRPLSATALNTDSDGSVTPSGRSIDSKPSLLGMEKSPLTDRKQQKSSLPNSPSLEHKSPHSPAGLSKALQQISHVFSSSFRKQRSQQDIEIVTPEDTSSNHSIHSVHSRGETHVPSDVGSPEMPKLLRRSKSRISNGGSPGMGSLQSLHSSHEDVSRGPSKNNSNVDLYHGENGGVVASRAIPEEAQAAGDTKVEKKKGFGLPSLPSIHLGLSKLKSSNSLKHLSELVADPVLPSQDKPIVDLPPPPPKANGACAILASAVISHLLENTPDEKLTKRQHVIASLPQRSNILLIDMRPTHEFVQEHIVGSVNVNLPPIVIKRFRKGVISAFSIDPFLLADTKTEFETWRRKCSAEPSTPRYVVVYDDDMTEQDAESEAWCMVSVLLLGLADHLYDVSSGRKFSTTDGLPGVQESRRATVGYVRGGFKELQSIPSSQPLIRASIALPQVNSIPPMSSLQFGSSITDSDSLSGGILSSTPSSLPLNSFLGENGPMKRGGRKASAFSINTATTAQPRRLTMANNQRPCLLRDAGSPQVRELRAGSFAPTVLSDITGSTPSHSTVSEPRMVSLVGDGDLNQQNDASSPLSASDMPTPTEPYSQILDWLYLGSDTVPTSLDAVDSLRKLGVTHVLNMAKEIRDDAVEHDGRFVFKWIKTEDSSDHAMEEPLVEAVDFIQNAHKTPGSIVFVHCKAGKSRSATAVLAWLITHNNMTLKEAYQHVRLKRPEASPNLGFFAVLMRMEQDIRGTVTIEQPNQ